MREKKFSKSRVLALVLAFAMVVTALPFAGFDAKAADDNNSVTVYRAYNTQTNDHLFTADENEYKTTIANPVWNDEGRAWSAPKSSSTPIYRAYNTSSGEHLFTADANEYNQLPSGWNKEGTLLYSDDAMGKPVYRLFCAEWDLHHYTTDENEVSALVASGSWVVDFGYDAAFYALGDQSAEVSLTDLNGLQADGTALTTDTLQIVFGSNFGTPTTVAWYRDGSVVKVITNNLTTAAFQMDPATDGTAGELTEGEYYAVVTNQNDESFTTNSIIVGTGVTGVLSDLSVNDNYDQLQDVTTLMKNGTTPSATQFATLPETNTTVSTGSVINFKLNKDYEGDLYIVDAEYADTYENMIAHATVVNDLDSASVTAVTKEKDFVDTKLDEAIDNVVVGTAAVAGLSYTNKKTGEVSYKLVGSLGANNAMTRGHEIVAIFDQDGSVKAGTTIDDWDVYDMATVPYLYAPDTLEVTDAQTATTTRGWRLQASFYGIQAAWLSNYNDGAALGTALASGVNTTNNNITTHLYAEQDGSGLDGTVFTTDAGLTVLGKSSTTTAAALNATANKYFGANGGTAQTNYVYGTMTIKKGIVSEEEVTLYTEYCSVVDDVAESATLSYDVTNPTGFTLQLSKLRAPATAYLVGTNNVTTTTAAALTAALANFDSANATTYVDTYDLSQGQTSATFVGSVEELKSATGGAYTVVIIPDDTASYAQKQSTNTVVEHQLVDFTLGGSTSGLTVGSGAAVSATGANITCLDQFGDKMSNNTIVNLTAAGVNMKAADSLTVDMGIKLRFLDDLGDDTKASIGLAAATPAAVQKAGDTYTATVGGHTVLLVCTTGGNADTAKFSITVV